MKKFSYLFCALALLLSAQVFSQVDRSVAPQQYKRPKSKHKPVDFVEQTVNIYKRELKIDDFQAAAVREIMEEEKDNLTALMNDKESTTEELNDRARIIYERMDAKVLPLLSEEQQKKYKELRRIKEEEGVELEPAPPSDKQ